MKYKYTTAEHLESFKTKGRVKLGTIEYYRRIEDEERGDKAEGVTIFNFHDKDNIIHLSARQLNAICNEFVFKFNLSMAPNSYFRSKLIVPNVYVLCVSNNHSKDLKNKFGGAVFKIKNIQSFNDILFKEISKRSEILFGFFDKVKYVDTKCISITSKNIEEFLPPITHTFKDFDFKKEIAINDYFTKTKEFSNEDEFRLIFTSKTKPIKDGIIIENKELIKFCEFF